MSGAQSVRTLPRRSYETLDVHSVAETVGSRFESVEPMNEGGTVVGQLEYPSGHAFRWDTHLGLRDLGVLPGTNMGIATGVNNQGTVVCYCGDSYWVWFSESRLPRD